MIEGADAVTGQIDEFINSDFVKIFEDNTDYLIGLHAVPYIMIVSMLFFSCFWYMDAACCCCGGSTLGSLAMVLHWIFWLPSLIGCALICGTGYVVTEMSSEIKLEEFEGKPNLEQLLDHLSVTFPNFWKLVVTPLEGPLMEIYQASILFVLFCILVFLYGCCVCCCRPYTGASSSRPEHFV